MRDIIACAPKVVSDSVITLFTLSPMQLFYTFTGSHWTPSSSGFEATNR